MDTVTVVPKATVLKENLTGVEKYFDPQTIATELMHFGVRLLSAILILVLGLLLIRLVVSLLRPTVRRTVADATVRRYTVSAAQIALWLILLVILLGVFGVEVGGIIAVLGTAGLAIGLALQGSLSNIAAGFMLLIFRPFKAGDQVEVAGVSGTAIEIGIFTSIVDMPDNVRAFVPNSMIFNGVIKNRSVNEYLRIEMKVTLAGDVDVQRAQQVIQRLLASNELVLDVPRPEVQVLEDDSPGIVIGIRPYAKLKNSDAVRTTVMQAVRSELQRAGIEMLKQ